MAERNKKVRRWIQAYHLTKEADVDDPVSMARMMAGIRGLLLESLSPRHQDVYHYVEEANREVLSDEVAEHLVCAHIDASIVLKNLADYKLLARRRDAHKSARFLYALPGLIGAPKKAHKFKRKDGYVFVSAPGHPRARGWGDHVQEHIIVMEKHIGRYLQDREVVHHKNGIRYDNRIENLELWVRPHPPGQRVSDLVEWATEFLREYAPERLVEDDRVGGSRDE